jgi:choline dehydrogenase-like flavoprotein
MRSDEAVPRDPKLRAPGVEGLRVVEASAMPDLLSLPTSMPAC